MKPEKKIKIAKAFISAYKKQSEIDSSFRKVMKAYDEDNMNFGMASIMVDSVYKIMHEIFTKEEIEWIDWFIWETNFGEKKMECSFYKDAKFRTYSFEELDEFLNNVFISN